MITQEEWKVSSTSLSGETHVCSEQGDLIAIIPDQHGINSGVNARFIAAVPKLLRICEGFCKANCEKSISARNMMFDHLVQLTKQASAKAGKG